LHLIKKNELNIHDIPIAIITTQYLAAIALMEELNLDVAGEYLVMAATLIHIKSKMLLPRPENGGGRRGRAGGSARCAGAPPARASEVQGRRRAAARARAVALGPVAASPTSGLPPLPATASRRSSKSICSRSSPRFKPSSSARSTVPKVLLPPEQMSSKRGSTKLLERLSETQACGFDELFADAQDRGGLIVTVPRAARDDSVEARAGVPGRLLRPDPRLQTRAPGRRAAPHRRSGDASWMSKTGRTGQEGQEGQEGQDEAPRAAAELKSILEAVIFASPEPLTPKAIFKLLASEPKEDVLAALDALKQEYEGRGGLQLVEIAGGYQIVTRPDLHEWVRRLFHERTTQKLTVQSLETLAVIAYRQPVTTAEISEIRGVDTGGVINTLLERHLVKIAGRKQVVGRPFLYATTKEFLIRFGLNDLTDLPKVEDMADALGLEAPIPRRAPAAGRGAASRGNRGHRGDLASRVRNPLASGRRCIRLAALLIAQIFPIFSLFAPAIRAHRHPRCSTHF
jgi:segregation and condensation protein B